MKTTLRLSMILLALAPLPGCFGGDDGAASTTQQLFFDDCGQHCTDDDWRLAAGGAHTTITAGLPFDTVRSSDESIVRFVPNQTKIEAFTGAPGVATIEVTGGGATVTRTVVVDAAAQLTINRVDDPHAEVRVLAGTPQIFHVTTRAADGQITRGDGAVTFELDGTLATALVPVEGDSVAFTGTVGSGRITASCPTASVSQDVTVVAEDAITSLSSSSETQADGTALVFVGAESSDGPVYAGACDWSGMDPSMKLSAQLPASIDFASTSLSTFMLDRAGTFSATCAMAGKTAAITLSR